MNIKLLCVLFIITNISCTKKNPKSVEVPMLDPQLISRAHLITNDYFTLANTTLGFVELRNKTYLSNVAKVGFNATNTPYSQSPKIFEHILGEVSEWELTSVVPKGLVTRFKYSVIVTLQEKPVDFWIDINQDYRLSKIYLFIHHAASGERVNLFKDAYIKF